MPNEIEIIGAPKNAKIIKTKSIRLPPGAHVPLKIEISMPAGSHLNAVAPNTLKLLRTSEASLINQEVEERYSESCTGIAVSHVDIPISDSLPSTTTTTTTTSTYYASIGSTIYYCDDLSGICSIESNVFVIPVILDDDSPSNRRIIIRRKVREPPSNSSLSVEELPHVERPTQKGTKTIQVKTRSTGNGDPSRMITSQVHTHESSPITLVFKLDLPEGYHFEKTRESTWSFDQTAPWFKYIQPLNNKIHGILTPSTVNHEREYRGAAGFMANDYAEEAVFNLTVFFCKGEECRCKHLTIVVPLSVEESAQGREHVVTVKHSIQV